MGASRDSKAEVGRRAAARVDAFNAAHPVGAMVRYWRMDGVFAGRITKAAGLWLGHTPLVWVEGAGPVQLCEILPDGVSE